MVMKIYYNDGEVEIYNDVEFEAYDLEGFISPIIEALIFDYQDKQLCIMLNRVKKIEFVDPEE